MLKLESISKIYYPDKIKPVEALKDVDLAFIPGELTAVIGSSGSGKTTLLNIIGGLDRKYDGSLFFNDSLVSEFDDEKLSDYRKDTVGFIFQHFNLINYMTVLDNVLLALSMTCESKKEKHDKAIKAIKDVGLNENLYQKADELSGGQKQRVAIARALVKDPYIILADEPTGALDSETSEEIITLLKDITQKGYMVIVISHDNLVSRHSDRVIELKDGSVINDNFNNTDKRETETVKSKYNRKFGFSKAFQLSWYRILSKRWRYFLVSIAAIIGIAGLTMSFSLNNGISEFIKVSYDKIVDARKLVVSGNEDYISSNDYFSLRGNENVDLVQAEYEINGRTEFNYEMLNFTVKNLHKEQNRDKYSNPEILFGSLPKDNEEGIVLSESTARRLIEENENIGDLVGREIEISFLSTDKISNYPARWDRHKLIVTGITEQNFIGEDYSYIGFNFHESIVRRSRFLGKTERIPTDTYGVYVKKLEELKTTVKELSTEYDVITPENTIKSLTRTFDMFSLAITGVSLLILFIAALMIGIILFISVLERKNEIGLLKALGGRNIDVKMIFFTESLLIGFFASVSSIVLSFILSAFANNYIYEIVKFQVLKMDIFIILTSIIFGLLINLISALIPAGKAAKLNPVELLRN